jgi:hypothetical protein
MLIIWDEHGSDGAIFQAPDTKSASDEDWRHLL